MTLLAPPAPARPQPPATPAAAKYATPRDLTRRTDGPRIGKIAKALGKPLMPWQQQVVDTATERYPNGDLVYELVLVTVPRQSGKTTLVGPVQVDRCMMTPNIKTFYTAQTGKDARSRFSDLVKLLQASPLAAVCKFRYSAGDEGVIFPNGSALKIFAPTESAIHGETPPLVTLDEIWEYTEALGDAMLEDAIIPAQVTLAGRRQVWLISTAGTALSVFMKKWVDRGRLGYPGLAYFEWGLPEGADPYDPEVIAAFHPAVGYTVTVEDLLQTAGKVSRAKWLRSFCNVWTETVDPIMPADDWAALAAQPAGGPPTRSAIAITYEIAPDNECGAVMASWRDAAGAPCIRVLHAAPGTTWMQPLIEQLHRDWRPLVLGADDGGPTRRLTAELRRSLGDDAITTLGARDFSTACEGLLTAAKESRTLKHDGSRTLSNAIAHLALKRFGDLWKFDRSGSTGPIAGLIAGAVGLWLYDHRETPLGKPTTKF